MADEELSVAELPALETPASEPAQEVETPELELPEGEEGDGEGQEEEVDELDFGFKKYSVPKSLKQAIEDLRADTTRKTQEASARQKALDAEKAQVEERLKVTDAELDDRASLRSVEKQLEAYAKLSPEDWAFHEAQDPARAQQAFRHFQLLKDQKNEVQTRLTTAQTQRTEAAQSDLTKRAQQVLDEAPKLIPGWTAKNANETITDLYNFAISQGVPEQMLAANWGPVLVKGLHRWRIGEQLLKKQATAPKANAVEPQTKPTVVVKSKNSPPRAGLSNGLSPEEWQRRFNKRYLERT